MSLKDTLKDKLGLAKHKAGDFAQQHGDKIESGIDKAAHTVDSKTGGKYTDKIETGVHKAKGALDHLKGKEEGGPDTEESGPNTPA
ncbi:antitoxin [Streptomyces sp. H10-C2]|uniref:antitoxin n=1 Tax=unclassified Streptomyces TaxID=2593676 RepID=UPI0024B9A9E6|nr:MULTISPECIES: antitoxin [unclassified Streptomyces]MDJ0341608.1 antitoxin [Streptomyces sp. PH10-H1]MDJ0371290.1 antitoxin [Streptomyces sp. H10-C2]